MRLTLIGLYNYDPTLFDALELPSPIDKEVFINSLLLSDGERPLLYTSPAFMKNAIGVWSMKHAEDFRRIARALTEEYNPIHNFDRNEEYSDQESGTDSTSTTGKRTDNLNNENTVSAFNSSTYQPDTNSKSTGDVSSIGDSKMNYGHKLEHKGHLYGNIGVTKSQEMVIDEIELRSKYSLYNVLAGMFTTEFCLYAF